MNRFFQLLAAFFVLILSVVFLSLQVPSTLQAEEESNTAQALQKLAKDVKFYTLPNGLRVILYERGTAPVFAGMVAVRVGGTDEVVGHTGISHMLEHMAFKGTPSIGTRDYPKEKKLLEELETFAVKERAGVPLSKQEVARREEINQNLKELWILGDLSTQFDKRGAADMNATTDKELTKYFVSLPRVGFEFWCWIESERILFPVMRQFYQERDVVLEERRMRFEDDPQGKLYEQLLGISYLKHPYRNPVIGYDFDVRRLTASMVADFHKQYYVPSNIVVSVVGSVNPDEDIKIIEKYFGRLPAGTAPSHPNIVEAAQTGERRIKLETNAAPELLIAYHKPNYPHPDDPAISLMAEIFAGSRISPLYTELVKIRRLASAVSHEEAPGSAYPNLLLFAASATSPHTNEEVLQAFDEVLAKFTRDGVTESQLEIAKRSTAMEYLGHLKSNMSLAEDFATSQLIYGDWRASLNWYSEMMKVTTSDIQKAAQTYLIPSSRTIGTVESSQALTSKVSRKKS